MWCRWRCLAHESLFLRSWEEEGAALTVASFGDDHERAAADFAPIGDRPRPARAPHSSYISKLQRRLSSKNSGVRVGPVSIRLAMRSRASAGLLCCASMALGPPPWSISCSSFSALRSGDRRRLFFQSGDFVLMTVFFRMTAARALPQNAATLMSARDSQQYRP